MIDDRVDFNNTMKTLGCGYPGKDYEDDAYGAAVALINWQQLTQRARDAWVQASVRTSHIGQFGVTKTFKGAFFGFLNQLRLQTFGISTDFIGEPANLLMYPWSLTDRDFQFCMLYIKTGNVPDPDKFEKQYLSKDMGIVVKNVEDTLLKKAKDYLEKGLVTIGGAGVELILKVKNATWGGLAISIAQELLMSHLKELQKQDVIARYNVDEERRIHLASKGQSTYQKITNL